MWEEPINAFMREDGRAGIRNLVVVMAAAHNVNPLARKLADAVPGVTCLPGMYGAQVVLEYLQSSEMARSA